MPTSITSRAKLYAAVARVRIPARPTTLAADKPQRYDAAGQLDEATGGDCGVDQAVYARRRKDTGRGGYA
ncbi:MAG: hypothetical protein ACJ780_17190 [Solirubrobacteraceae bacterium]